MKKERVTVKKNLFFFFFPGFLFLFPTFIFAALLSNAPNNLGLVGYWPLNEGAGTVATDFSGFGSRGTLTNMEAADWVNGKRGKALNFDGSDEYIDTGNHAAIGSLTNNFTVSAWINADTFPTLGRIVGHARANSGTNGFGFGVRTGGSLRFTTMGVKDYDSTSITLIAGTWYHVVAVLDSSDDVTFYVDGVSRQTVTHTAPGAANTDDNFYIGAVTANGSATLAELFDGKIDDVRIYNRALSATEVAKLYRSGSVGRSKIVSESGLVLHWAFDDGRGASTTDSSGKGYIGSVLRVDPSLAWVPGKLGKAIGLDGDAYVLLDQATPPLTASPGTNYTVAAWFRIASTSVPFGYDSTARILQHGGNLTSNNTTYIELNISTTSGVKVNFSTRPDTFGSTKNVNSTTEIQLGRWYHAAGVVSSGTMNLYVNGVAEGTPTAQATPGTHRRFVIGAEGTIGGRVSGGSPGLESFFPGDVDEVYVYNRALSAAEVKELYETTAAKINSSQNNRVANGLVGMWSFNGPDITTVVSDVSGSGNDGYIFNSATSTMKVAGKVGQGLQFDGTNDYVNISNESNFDFDQTTFTVSAWVKTVDGGVVISKGGGSSSNSGWVLQHSTGPLSTPGAFAIIYKSDGGTNQYTLTTDETSFGDNLWHHVVAVMTYDTVTVGNNTATIYVDGTQRAATPNTPTQTPDLNDLTVKVGVRSRSDGVVQSPFKGLIDEVRIYNRALTASEVKQLYNAGR